MTTIKQIDDRTVHQIQSGQVIVDLCSVVKELVENSIDAGANIIDVRFKNQGLDLIEVQDNGSGISPANYASVGLKHHTSKLSSYADIGTLVTFGFRGEALASLCALSTLGIVTCLAEDVPKGSKLVFEASGKLKSTSVVASQRGTAVSVEKLFHNLPVRRRELERNIKREWHKVIALLNQYACIQTNLKFTVSQQPTKGKRMILFSTKGNATTRDNIINIFGAKTMTALVPLDLRLEMQPTTLGPALQASVDTHTISKDVKIVGHVSRPSHGEGRQTPDRQMFFVNGRPCGLPQFAKTFNEVYRSYNSSQSPFIFADIQLDTHMYDVNVSPDKRTILLHDQNQLLDTIRKSLIEIFDAQEHTVPASLLAKPSRASASAGKLDFTPSKASEPESAGLSSTFTRPRSLSSGESSVAEQRAGTAGSESNESVDSGTGPREESVESSTLGQRIRGLANTSNDALVRTVSADDGDMAERLRKMDSSPDDSTSRSSSPISQHQLEDVRQGPAGERLYNEIDRMSETDTQISTSLSRASTPYNTTIPSVRPLKGGGLKESVLVQRSPSKTAASRPPASIMIGDRTPGATTTLDGARGASSEKEVVAASRATPTFGSSLSKMFGADARSSKRAESIDSRQSVSSTDELESTATDDPQSRLLKAAFGASGGATREYSADYEGESRSHAEAAATKPVDSASELGESDSDHSEPDDSGSEGSSPEQVAKPQDAAATPRLPSAQPGARRKYATFQTAQNVSMSEDLVHARMVAWTQAVSQVHDVSRDDSQAEDLASPDAEAKLSLYISKSDFSKMKVVGQFNMGFVIAVRPAAPTMSSSNDETHDELFIIDQHASDEKFNFERLQEKTVVQSQRLVHPKQLELTALEEEIVMENLQAIEANGFQVAVDGGGESPVGSRCQLTALPMSREITFDLKDLEELISLLGDNSSDSAYIPRPSKVRKMFASRACRSSIMVGKALTRAQMYALVGHMGELDKPWNCPHGRPTMRHLYRMQTWDDKGWPGDTRAMSGSVWQSYAQGL